MIQHHSHKEDFLRHINSVDSSIQFTVEIIQGRWFHTFLDTIITPNSDGTFTEGYTESPLTQIYTLSHRAHTICPTPELLKRKFQHLEKVLMLCKYPKWAINKVFHQQQEKKEGKKEKQNLQINTLPKMPYSSALYTRHM